MAKIYGELLSSALMTFDKSFSRSNGQPLDSTEVFYSKSAAEDYAKTDVAYVGQKIVVIATEDDTTTVTHYSIEADNSLKELGAIPVDLGNRIDALEDAKHTHNNEEVLNQITLDDYNDLRAWSEFIEDNVPATELSVLDVSDRVDAIEEREHEHTNKTVLDDITSEKVAAWDDAAQTISETAFVTEDGEAWGDALNRISELEKVDHDHTNKTVLDGITEAKVSAWDTAEQNAVDRVLGYLATEEVNTNYDTLKEVAAWIESDTTASAELITRVSNIEKDYLKGADKTELEGEIDSLSAFVGDIPEGSTSDTVIAYIKEVVDALKIGDYAKATELTELAARVTAVENAIKTLNGDKNTAGSVDKKIADAIDGANLSQYAKDADVVHKSGDEMTGPLTVSEIIEEADATYMTTVNGGFIEFNDLGAGYDSNISVHGAYFQGGGSAIILDGSGETGNKVTLAVGEENVGLSFETETGDACATISGLADAVNDDEAVNLGQVNTLIAAAVEDKANNGTTLSDYGITDAYTKTETENRLKEVLEGLSDTSETAASVAQALETYKTSNDQRVGTIESKLNTVEENAEENIIEAIKLNDVVLTVVNKAVNIPVGGDTLGAVKSATGDNKVTIAEDGVMSVAAVNVSSLVQTDGETLILNGGSSAN